MKKLNITKKQYDESKYFNKKYGALKFVSESGKLYKTDKGVVLALEGTENQPAEGDDAQGAEGGAQKADESLKDIGNAIKDTAKELGSKAKAGLKKGAKAVSNFFNGNFRKNDTVEISGGEDSDGNPVTLKGVVKDAGKDEVTIGISREAAESDDGDATEVGEDVTRGELTDILKDVVAEVEKVCDSQDISFEEVAGIEKPEGESDEEADKDEVIATKDDVADALQGVIDAVEKVADANDIELPEEEDDDGEGAGDDDDTGVTVDEGCDCGKANCPECGKKADECGGQACECGDKEKMMESRKARARLVREAVIRRAKARKVRESIERRRRVRKVMESIRRRRAAKKVLESIRKRHEAKKVMESTRKTNIKKLNSVKKVMEARRARALRAGLRK